MWTDFSQIFIYLLRLIPEADWLRVTWQFGDQSFPHLYCLSCRTEAPPTLSPVPSFYLNSMQLIAACYWMRVLVKPTANLLMQVTVEDAATSVLRTESSITNRIPDDFILKDVSDVEKLKFVSCWCAWRCMWWIIVKGCDEVHKHIGTFECLIMQLFIKHFHTKNQHDNEWKSVAGSSAWWLGKKNHMMCFISQPLTGGKVLY